MRATPAKMRQRSMAHRWGPACAAATHAEQWALGIRYDEEDGAAAETLVARLTRGKVEMVDQLPGSATALAVSTEGVLFVLDERAQVIVGGRKHRLASPRAITWLGDGVVVAGADRLWIFSGDGAQVREGPAIRARRLASSAEGLVAALDDGTLLFFDDVLTRGSASSGRQLVTDASGWGELAALSIDDEGMVTASSGRAVLCGAARSGRLATLCIAPFDVHAVARHGERVLLSSRTHGLFAVAPPLGAPGDAGEGGVEGGMRVARVVPFRPSLRAHTLVARAGLLVIASDLFVATSDGVDLNTRDLTSFVRLADQRLPRFLASDDPLSV
jgi:hypothetical protein